MGRSPALVRAAGQVRRVAATDAPVLVLGETGTGKDLVARAVHDRSPRRGRPLVTVNCAALPPTLIESELFGYEKGAFTGAIARTPGRFEVADGGTLLLDEIGELPLEVQAKLLRVLQTGEFERLGSSKALRADVRLVAATNRDLEREVREGRFRADLFYRLSVFPLTLPPLRSRPEDIPLLVWHVIARKQAPPGAPHRARPRPDDAGVPGLPLAGEHPRAGERGRARPHPLDRPRRSRSTRCSRGRGPTSRRPRPARCPRSSGGTSSTCSSSAAGRSAARATRRSGWASTAAPSCRG